MCWNMKDIFIFLIIIDVLKLLEGLKKIIFFGRSGFSTDVLYLMAVTKG